MNKKGTTVGPSETSQYRSLQILDELAKDDALTQRDLSRRLGIALGLVNSYLKNLIAKGYITVKNIPPKRYTYYLTPNGFTEKTRLAYHLLQDYTRIYQEAKRNFRTLFHDLEREGAKRIVFAGADEVAEIAYITLQETTLALVGIVDDDKAGEKFFSLRIASLNEVQKIPHDCIVVTSYLKQDALTNRFLSGGYRKSGIRMTFPDEQVQSTTSSRPEIAS